MALKSDILKLETACWGRLENRQQHLTKVLCLKDWGTAKRTTNTFEQNESIPEFRSREKIDERTKTKQKEPRSALRISDRLLPLKDFELEWKTPTDQLAELLLPRKDETLERKLEIPKGTELWLLSIKNHDGISSSWYKYMLKQYGSIGALLLRVSKKSLVPKVS